jgi:hypothetical protein
LNLLMMGAHSPGRAMANNHLLLPGYPGLSPSLPDWTKPALLYSFFHLSPKFMLGWG